MKNEEFVIIVEMKKQCECVLGWKPTQSSPGLCC